MMNSYNRVEIIAVCTIQGRFLIKNLRTVVEIAVVLEGLLTIEWSDKSRPSRCQITLKFVCVLAIFQEWV